MYPRSKILPQRQYEVTFTSQAAPGVMVGLFAQGQYKNDAYIPGMRTKFEEAGSGCRSGCDHQACL